MSTILAIAALTLACTSVYYAHQVGKEARRARRYRNGDWT